ATGFGSASRVRVQTDDTDAGAGEDFPLVADCVAKVPAGTPMRWSRIRKTYQSFGGEFRLNMWPRTRIWRRHHRQREITDGSNTGRLSHRNSAAACQQRRQGYRSL